MRAAETNPPHAATEQPPARPPPRDRGSEGRAAQAASPWPPARLEALPARVPGLRPRQLRPQSGADPGSRDGAALHPDAPTGQHSRPGPDPCSVRDRPVLSPRPGLPPAQQAHTPSWRACAGLSGAGSGPPPAGHLCAGGRQPACDLSCPGLPGSKETDRGGSSVARRWSQDNLVPLGDGGHPELPAAPTATLSPGLDLCPPPPGPTASQARPVPCGPPGTAHLNHPPTCLSFGAQTRFPGLNPRPPPTPGSCPLRPEALRQHHVRHAPGDTRRCHQPRGDRPLSALCVSPRAGAPKQPHSRAPPAPGERNPLVSISRAPPGAPPPQASRGSRHPAARHPVGAAGSKAETAQPRGSGGRSLPWGPGSERDPQLQGHTVLSAHRPGSCSDRPDPLGSSGDRRGHRRSLPFHGWPQATVSRADRPPHHWTQARDDGRGADGSDPALPAEPRPQPWGARPGAGLVGRAPPSRGAPLPGEPVTRGRAGPSPQRRPESTESQNTCPRYKAAPQPKQ